ncbi:glycosyltransferase [Desulfotomaculum sp. 1211_IL3151]|uniref:glycosyltransferase n=1 Tax=Desulfotomaculum sp. 1211_IL3151 TaxID=3084055 RepID=UPI002FDA175B
MISLCMIVKNEEHNLARCLNSAKDCVDEMIIVDTGSEDATVSIAEQFGAKIFHYQWNEDFAAARNFGLDQAKGDWILYLDADEELEPNCSERIKALTKRSNVEAYIFQITNLTDNNDPLKHVNVRMFRNKPAYRFEGKLHEQIISSITPRAKGTPVINSGINILHYGYLASEFIAKNKARRNHRINMKLVEQDPNNPFYLFSLGGSCVNLNNLEEAISNYSKALQYVNIRAMYAPSIFVSLTSCLLKLGRIDEAVTHIEKCKAHYPDYVDIHYIDGELFNSLGHIRRAITSFEKCLQLGEQCQGKYTTRTGVGSFLPNFKLAEIYKKIGNHKKALHYQLQGLRLKNNDMQQYVNLAKLLKASLQDGKQVYTLLKKNVKHADKNTEKLMLSRMLYEIEEYELAIRLFEQLSKIKPEIYYYMSRSLVKIGRYQQAVSILPEINDSHQRQRIFLELVAKFWATGSPRDLLPYLEQDLPLDEEFIDYLKGINDLLLKQTTEIELNPHNYYFNEIINELLEHKAFALVLSILNLCGFDNTEIINLLTSDPPHEGRFEMAARLAINELKINQSTHEKYYALGRYFYNNQEYDSAQTMLHKALALHAAEKVRNLLQEIYLKQTLNMIQEALKNYPDNADFMRQLIKLQMKSDQKTLLKGVH